MLSDSVSCETGFSVDHHYELCEVSIVLDSPPGAIFLYLLVYPVQTIGLRAQLLILKLLFVSSKSCQPLNVNNFNSSHRTKYNVPYSWPVRTGSKILIIGLQ